MFQRTWKFWLTVVVCAGLWTGCDERPWVTGKADPRQEANFRQADAYQRLGQYPKAIEYFQRALDVNPRNADAHLGLGLIYSDSTKLPEYGYAYYHLNRYVEMAKATNDAIVIPLIQASGLKLAERYATAIGRIQTQGEMEQVRKENSDLRRAVAALTEQLSIAQARLGLAAAATNRVVMAKQVSPPVTVTGPAPAPAPAPTQGPLTRPITQTNPPPQIRRPTISTNRIATSTSVPTTATTRPAPRAYKVQPRDTMASIAKQNGVGLPQLQAANPGVDSRHLKVGQELRIP